MICKQSCRMSQLETHLHEYFHLIDDSIKDQRDVDKIQFIGRIKYLTQETDKNISGVVRFKSQSSMSYAVIVKNLKKLKIWECFTLLHSPEGLLASIERLCNVTTELSG